MRFYLPALALLGAVTLSSAGCGNACVDLAKQICSCQPTKAKQADCQTRVDTQKLASDANKAERQRCSELVDTCTCAAIACGDLAACGLARDSGLAPDVTSCQ